jgi:hypothetical protein
VRASADQAGVECAVTVSVKGDSTGKFRLGLLIYHSGKTQLSNVFVTGTVGSGRSGGASGLPANEIESFPIELDFGTAKGSTPMVRSIALRNSSSNPVTISGIELAASSLTGFSIDAPSCKELQASQACVATVTWSPTTEGTSEGVLILRHSGPSGSLQIPLKGVYELAKTNKAELFPSAVAGTGLLVADREGVDFGSSIDGAASITVSLVNNGDKDVALQQVKLAGSDNGLTLSTDGCSTGRVLAPKQGCALTVNWAPRRAGPVIDDIQIIHDGARGVLVLPVRGTATSAASGSLPSMNAISTLPKMNSGEVDEKLVGGAGVGEVTFGEANASSLNGYRVTSMSGNRAIIAGPRGRVLVTEGERQMVAGGYWKPVITYDGVKLVGAKDTVMLFFDRTMTVGKDNGGGSSFPSSSGGAAPEATVETSSGSGSTTAP